MTRKNALSRFENELLEWFRTRRSDVLDSVRSTGAVPDEEALEAAIGAFADQFVGSGDGSGEPDVEAQAEASTSVVDASNTLPEEDVSRAESV